jgi:hypothetical protein
MTTDTVLQECKHGLWPASSCTWCNGKELPLFAKSRAFRARFKSRCFVCKRDIRRGDYVVKMSSSKITGYVHAEHAGDE